MSHGFTFGRPSLYRQSGITALDVLEEDKEPEETESFRSCTPGVSPSCSHVQSAERPVGAVKRKQTVPVFREIVKLQKTADRQIPRAPFSRLVREFMQRAESRGAGLRITPNALEALHESSERYLEQTFNDSYLITQNRQQVTLAPKDMQLLMFIRSPPGAWNR